MSGRSKAIASSSALLLLIVALSSVETLPLNIWGARGNAGAGAGAGKNSRDAVNLALEQIARVDVDLDQAPSYQEYHARVNAQMREIVRQVSSPWELKRLFWECTLLHRRAPERPQERLQWIDPHCCAADAIIERLADLKSETATKVLVELFGDETLAWDGAGALGIGHAISRCGRRALPFLAKIRASPSKTEFVRRIERGELYW